MKNDHYPSFSVDVSINFGTQILVFVISAFTSILVARALGPGGKGVFSLVIVIPAIIAQLASMGINFSNIYLVGKKKYPVGLIAGNSFLYSILAGTLLALVVIVFVPFFSPYILKGAPGTYLYITLPLVPFLLLFDNVYYILVGYRKMKKLALVSISRALLYFVALILFSYPGGLSVYKAVYAYFLSWGIALAMGVYFLARDGYLLSLALDWKIFMEGLKFGAKQHLGTISQLLNYRLDFLIVAALLDPAQVGLYSVAVLIGETIWYISRSVGQILYSKITFSSREESNKFTPLVCRNTVFLTFVATLVLFGIAGIIIPWMFTPKFLPSVMALKILLPGIFFLGVGRVLGSDLTGRGYPQYSSFAAFISLILTVILDLLLIPRFGINGASLASSIAYMANAFIILGLFKKVTGIRISDILVIKSTDIVVYQRMVGLFRFK
jgi:O-antigen/teichoic acid export membrane protein